MDDASFCSAATFDETAQTLSVSTLGRPSEVLMTATQGASTAAGAGGRSPPFRGRTMKEYEEMLAQLRKENFNLKLRLYFLEERAGAAGEGGDGEAGAAVRSELERLRREAAEKQQLLCEAARAVELLEEQHREQLRAARAAAQQAQAEAQKARAEAQKARAEAQRTRQVACAAEVATSESDEELASDCSVSASASASATAALFARIEEADAEVTAAREAAARAAAEAALQAEEMRLELRQAREVALEAAEAARAARAVGTGARSPPCSPSSSTSASSSCEGERLRGAVERAQAQLAALEAELGSVRAELRRQTEARAAAERGLAEGRAMHAKSLQTVQALARLCKERSREADGLRARLRGDHADAAATTPATTPATPPRSPSHCEDNDGAGSDSASAHSGASASAASDKSATLPSTVTRRQVEQLRSFLDQKKEQLLKLAAERDELSSSLLCRLQLLQARAQAQEEALAARETQLRQAEERARRLEEEVALLRAPPSAANADPCTEPGDIAAHIPGSPPPARTSPAPGSPPPVRTSPSLGSLSLTRMSPAPESPPADRTSPAPGSLPPSRTSPAPGSPPPARTSPPPARTSPAPAAVVEEEDEKDRVIARLSAELRRRTANLQELVNKELWDKNRQIERLQARLTRMGTPAAPRSTPVPTPATTPTSTHASDSGVRREGDGGDGEEETEATLRRQLAEGVCERERLAAQLEELRRRALLPALPPPATDNCSSCDAARDALARAEAGRRDALAACAALARRLDALARALPPLLRRRHRHRPRHARRAPAGGDADVDVLALSGGDAPGVAGGGGGGGRKLSALERALASAARAARALASLDQQGSVGAGPRARASESEVDAWSEPDRAVSLARVGLSPLSERRAAVVAAGSVSSEDDAAAARAGLRAKSLTMGLGLAMGLEEEELLLDDDDIDRSDSEENYSSDETIDSESSRFRILESSEMQRLRSRVADLETRVSEKDNELLEQQCAMLEMRNTYTARCMEAENQLAELLAHVRQVQADAEVERRFARNQVQLQGPLEINSQDNGIHFLGNTTGKLSHSQLEQDGHKLDVVCDVEDKKMPQQPHINKEEKEMQEEKDAGKAELVVEVQNEAETEQRGAEVEAERRMRLAEAALVRQRDAAAVARARSALERTQLMGERLRLERALRREEAAAATAARQHRRERTQLHEHILQLSRRLHAALTTNGGGAVVAVGGVTPPPSPTPATTPTPTAGTLSPCPSLLQLQQLPYASPSQTSTEACVWTISHPPGEPSHGAGSPDLGIESDAGRFSSLEPLSSNCGSCDQEGTQSLCGFQGTDVESEFTRLQRENSNLKRNLSRTKKLLEATVTQLSSSNELKRQMELVICRQLNKTKCVLKEAKGDDEVSIEPVK